MEKNRYELHGRVNSQMPFIFHCAIEPNDRMMPNWHENLEIIYCFKGSGSVKYNENVYPLRAGEMVVVNSEVIHHVFNTGDPVYHCMIIDRGFCESNGIDVKGLHFQEKIADATLGEAFTRIFAVYDAYTNEQLPYGATELRAKTLDFLCSLCRKYAQPAADRKGSNKAEEIKQALLYINQNYARALSLGEIAGYAGLSKSYLAREFKKYTNKTVFEMILNVRCKEARRRIAAGETASQAALACGFESLSYFSRVFKRCYGVSPSEFRKK